MITETQQTQKNLNSRQEKNPDIDKQLHIPRILIVEDDITLEPIWTYVVDRVSRQATVVWATSEAEAEELILSSIQNNCEYDLVITDIFLSGSKTGIDLWSKFYYALHGRMIITSGIEYQKFMKHLGESPAEPLYIQKPLNPNECINAVFGMLQRSNSL